MGYHVEYKEEGTEAWVKVCLIFICTQIYVYLNIFISAKHVHTFFIHYKKIFLLFQAKDKEVRGTKFVITGLKENAFYKFRVLAFNAAGLSEPGEVADALEMKDRISESQ